MNDSKKFHRSAGFFASAALLAAMVTAGWSSNAHALPCLEEAAGGGLNCTANDLGIASITVGLIADGCDGTPGDTFTFDGTLNTDGGTQRYDVGYYIGASPLESTDDDCSVAIIPPAFSDVDGDACGDSSNLAQAVPVTAITAPCQDSNDDGFFDVNTCVAYDNSAGNVCNGPEDAIPGTPSKCSCEVVETTEVVPHCTLPEFADRCEDNNPCTNDICNTVVSGLGDLFGCSHTNNSNPCRASAGNCDVAENCTAGACPADGFLTSVCRASTGVCDPSETCTGSSASCPTDAFLTSVCRAANGICDVAESCDGSSGACPVNGFSSGNTCRASGGVCDVAETCSGSSANCPGDGFSEGNTCRASGGVCDVVEACSGNSVDCPADGFSQGNTCRASGGVCDVVETCSGSSANCPSDGFSQGNTCRASGGVCDVVEACSGSAATCPSDSFSSGNTCRSSGGICDVTEECSGSAATCPGDSFSSGNTCRASGGVCDAAETCNGEGANCPVDSFSSGNTCRASGGVCDVAETCNGSNADCPSDGFVSSEQTCRGSAGVCDVAENCTGQESACPADGFVSSTTVCRSDAGQCDVADTCTGASASCPSNGFEPQGTDCAFDENPCTDDECNGAGACVGGENSSTCDDGLFCNGADTCVDGTCSGHAGDPCAGGGICGDICTEATNSCFDQAGTVCRASGGICDVAETCTGSNSDCPANGFSSGNTCRATNGVCDAAETCSGSAAGCPADAFTSGGTCRASNGVCDIAETCSGSSANCPANGFTVGGTCRASNGVCDVAETCSGAAATCPNDGFVAGGTVCRADAGVCDVAEACTGAAAACPAQGFEPSGTACTSDDNVCTNDQCNSSGSCLHPNNTAPCDDSQFCTVGDTCAAGQCSGTPRVCGDAQQCTIDACNESTNSCEFDPQNERCEDDNFCTTDFCDVELGCTHVFSCVDICRGSNFYGKRAGGDDNVVQQILDGVDGLSVCGEFIDETSINDSVAGLGLDSALEGLCVRTDGVDQRSLYRELVTTALNCAMSGSQGDFDFCDDVVSRYIEVDFSECNSLCAGDIEISGEEGDSSSLASECTKQLKCYNNGGKVIDGQCAYGRCDITNEYCGGGHGGCPPIGVISFPILQVCERFNDACTQEKFCQPGLEICPEKLRPSSSSACREAKRNDCTIDFCAIDDD